MSADRTNRNTPQIEATRAEIERAVIYREPGNGVLHLDKDHIAVRTARGIGIVNRNRLATILGEATVDVLSATEEQIRLATEAGMAIPNLAHQCAEPPRLADHCLALFLSGAKSEAIIGDLSERFRRDCEQHGAGRARRMYWDRTLRSLWPLLRRAIARAFKWGVVIESVRRFF
jgi:hypothetical protein